MYPTYEQLKELVGTKGKDDIIKGVVKYLQIYAPQYDLNTSLRICHFIAQAAHETDGFHTLTEYASGADYEGRKDLGNTQKGDGIKYKGRGIFQITGRANYATLGTKLGVDLVNNPELAATPEISVRTALEYWKQKGLNKYADQDDVKAVTLRINGGYNGLVQRTAYLNKIKDILQDNDNPVLAKIGDTSDFVASVQNLLNKLGNKLIVDGKFGPKTEQAIKDFQQKNKLSVTGYLDQRTLDTLKNATK